MVITHLRRYYGVYHATEYDDDDERLHGHADATRSYVISGVSRKCLCQ